MKKRALIIMTVLLGISSFGRGAERNVINVNDEIFLNTFTKEGADNLMIFDQATKRFSSYYHIVDSDRCHINYSSIDPSGRLIALGCFCRLSKEDNCHFAPTGFYKISVIDLKHNKEILSFEHGYSFEFSPDGNSIAINVSDPSIHDDGCIPAPGYEDAYGLWIYDFKNKEKKRIDTDSVGVMHLSWSKHDGNIYVSNNQDIFRYDVSSGKGNIIEGLKGIEFSPDGRYYLGLSPESRLIYQSSDNQPVNKWNDKLPEIGKYAGFLEWLDGGSKVLVYSGNYDYCVFDLETAAVVQNIKGHVIGSDAKGTKLLIHPAFIRPDQRVDINREAFEIINVAPVR